MYNILTALLFPAALALAAPAPAPIPSPAPAAVSRSYILQAHVTNAGAYPQAHSHFDGMYVSSYHTGAGLNDGVFSANKAAAAVGFLNNTEQIFTLGEYQYGLELGLDTFYTNWGPTQINIGQGMKGFFINDTGLFVKQGDTGYGFSGWRACDWWHYDVPQLFWKTGGTGNAKVRVTGNCADINLVPIYV